MLGVHVVCRDINLQGAQRVSVKDFFGRRTLLRCYCIITAGGGRFRDVWAQIAASGVSNMISPFGCIELHNAR